MSRVSSYISGDVPFLGWIADPEALPGLSRSRPDSDANFIIVGRYRRVPEGGRRLNPTGPWIWCCHCQKESHWEGFVIQTQDDTLHLIGNDCGLQHYGADRFKTAQNVYRDIEKREKLFMDVERLKLASQQILYDLDRIIGSEFYKNILEIRQQIKRSSPDVLNRIRSAAIIGNLITYEPIKNEKGNNDVARVNLGPLEGDILVLEHELVAIQEVRQVIFDLQKIDINSSDTATLKNNKKRVGYGLKAIVDLMHRFEDADKFFSERNVNRMIRWSGHLRKFFSISFQYPNIIIQDSNARISEITPLKTRKLPNLEVIPKIA